MNHADNKCEKCGQKIELCLCPDEELNYHDPDNEICPMCGVKDCGCYL